MTDRPSTDEPSTDEPSTEEASTDPPRATPADDTPTEAAPPGGATPATDVEPVAESTLAAPSFRAPIDAAQLAPKRPELNLNPGETIDDFQVVELIGRGAFGGVYLAKQVSLDRLVALKVTANRGSEGRTLAQLEHDYIVRVFSEVVDATGRFRLLCMQLVPGAALEDVISRLRRTCEEGRGGWTGADYLAAIDPESGEEDGRSRVHDVFDPTALKDRELIGRLDDVQASAWVGARLAEAVDYAHQRSVLHRDIKPANVLVNRYGRPLLADFNIAERTMPDGGTSGAFGGTIAFMAPEHLDAFNPRNPAGAAGVDERADLYSLGIVVHELLTGRPPFQPVDQAGGRVTLVGDLADARRTAPPPISSGPSCARKVLERTIARVLEPAKEDRYESGSALGAALEGAAALRTAEREFPKAGWLTRAMQKNALLWLALLVVIPQVISSVVNISYNGIEIVGYLDDAQRELFMSTLVPGYNLLVYPLLLGLGVLVVLPVFRVWREVQGRERVDPARVDEARRRALRLPLWLLLLVAAGWLPGGLIFPLLIDRLQGPVPWQVYGHFLTSFTLSGLIAAAYSYGGLQFLVLRVMYPRLWADASGFRDVARSELASSLWRIRFIPRLAVSVPSVAVLVLLMADRGPVDFRFRILCGSLILLGWIGYEMASSASRSISHTLVALTGREA